MNVIFVVFAITLFNRISADDSNGQNETMKCGEYEAYNYCNGSSSKCPLTCENYKNASQVNCTGNCTAGCVCKEGFVRMSDKKCVKEEECSKKNETCVANMEHKDCIPCIKNCMNFNKNISCTTDCKPGCACKDGFVQLNEKKCIKQEECPKMNETKKECGEDEVYSDCVNNCTQLCKNRLKKQLCPLFCMHGCGCKNSFYRNKAGKCVEEKDCCKEEADENGIALNIYNFFFSSTSDTRKNENEKKETEKRENEKYENEKNEPAKYEAGA